MLLKTFTAIRLLIFASPLTYWLEGNLMQVSIKQSTPALREERGALLKLLTDTSR